MMLNKSSTIAIDSFKTLNINGEKGIKRVHYYENGDLLIIANDEEKYIFHTFRDGKEIHSLSLDYSFGHLSNVVMVCGVAYLEFKDTLQIYDEEYNLVKLSGGNYYHLASLKRESYLHNLPYVNLFEKDGTVYLNVIRFNRIHQYVIDGSSLVEIDYIDGGKWYLCGKYSVCDTGQMLELYDDNFELCSAFEYGYGIDLVCSDYSVGSNLLAAAFTDTTTEQSAVITYQNGTNNVNISFNENIIHNLCISGGRVIINPQSFNPSNDLGGLMIYDKNSELLYAHVKSRQIDGKGFSGAFIPPFHWADKFAKMPNSMVLAVDDTRAVLLDYNLYAIQEIIVPSAECVDVSSTGELAVLRLNRQKPDLEEAAVYEKVLLDRYEVKDTSLGGKVIEMHTFKEK